MIPRCHLVCMDCLAKHGIRQAETVNSYQSFWLCPHAKAISITQYQEHHHPVIGERDFKRFGDKFIYADKPIGHECPSYIDHLLASTLANKPTRKDKKKKARTKAVCKCCREKWDRTDEKLWKKYRLVQCPAMKGNHDDPKEYDAFDRVSNPIPENCRFALEHLVCT